MKPKRNNEVVLADVLSHVGIIFATALRIAGRNRMCHGEAVYWLRLLVKQGRVERRKRGTTSEYRLVPRSRSPARGIVAEITLR